MRTLRAVKDVVPLQFLTGQRTKHSWVSDELSHPRTQRGRNQVPALGNRTGSLREEH